MQAGDQLELSAQPLKRTQRPQSRNGLVGDDLRLLFVLANQGVAHLVFFNKSKNPLGILVFEVDEGCPNCALSLQPIGLRAHRAQRLRQHVPYQEARAKGGDRPAALGVLPQLAILPFLSG